MEYPSQPRSTKVISLMCIEYRCGDWPHTYGTSLNNIMFTKGKIMTEKLSVRTRK